MKNRGIHSWTFLDSPRTWIFMCPSGLGPAKAGVRLSVSTSPSVPSFSASRSFLLSPMVGIYWVLILTFGSGGAAVSLSASWPVLHHSSTLPIREPCAQ